MKRFSDFERGAICMIIDGEGSLDFGGNSPRIRITNTNVDFLKNAQDLIEDGRIRCVRGQQGNHKAAWQLTIGTLQGVKNILMQVKFSAKERQRMLMLEAINLLENKPPAYHERLDTIKSLVAELNRRGTGKGVQK